MIKDADRGIGDSDTVTIVASPAMPAPKLATAIQPPPAAIRMRASDAASGPMARPVPCTAKDVTKPKPSAA